MLSITRMGGCLAPSCKGTSKRWKRRIISFVRSPKTDPPHEAKMTPPGEREPDPQLTSTAKLALGNLKPPAVAEQVRVLVGQAFEYQQDESQKLLESYNLPIDETNLTEVLELFNPVKLVNELLYATPELPVQHLMKQAPLKVLLSVVKMLTVSDHYASLK